MYVCIEHRGVGCCLQLDSESLPAVYGGARVRKTLAFFLLLPHRKKCAA